MSEGIHTSRYHEDTETFHTTTYDDEGRHSFDWNPETGDVTGDHCVSNEDQDEKLNFEPSNIWDDIENDESSDDE